MRYLVGVSCLVLALFPGIAGAQSCAPAALPRDPAPASSTVSQLARMVGDFDVNENQSKTVELTVGKSYWFAAAGCSRMGEIRIDIVDAAGQTVATDRGYGPSICFSPAQSGRFTVKVTALSMSRSSLTWGSLNAVLSSSSCVKR